MLNRRHVVSALLASATVRPASAQGYPAKTIRIIVPFTPGSPVDVAARLLGQQLTIQLGQGVVIDNRPGAGTTIGMRTAVIADPDGYTLLVQSSSLVVAPAMYKSLDYDPVKALAPVAYVAGSHWLTVVPASLPVKTVPEFIAYAKANPGKLNFGFGQGTAPQLVGEWLKRTNNLNIASVPYRGGTQAMADMSGGNIQLSIGTPSTLLPLIHQGKVRAISTWAPKRLPELPDVPTMIESGFPGLSLTYWTGLWAPAATPAAIIEKLNNATNTALRSPEMKAAMHKLGVEPIIGTPKDFAAFIAEERPKWAKIVETSGVKID
jgi:tripartite-type tricarboxylate transporter receptor subunit TctC